MPCAVRIRKSTIGLAAWSRLKVELLYCYYFAFLNINSSAIAEALLHFPPWTFMGVSIIFIIIITIIIYQPTSLPSHYTYVPSIPIYVICCLPEHINIMNIYCVYILEVCDGRTDVQPVSMSHAV